MQTTSSKLEFSPRASERRISKTSNRMLECFVAGVLQQASRSLDHRETIAFAICSADDNLSGATEEGYPRLRRDRWLRTPSTRLLGRLAASQALQKLGIEGISISRGQMGEPIWPEGITGSITHCYPWSVAVAMPSDGQVTVGIDLERVDHLEGFDISSIVCRGAEPEWIRGGGNSYERLCMIFSAKEALYKSLYSHYPRYIDFTEVELMWLAEQSCFRAEFFPEHGCLPQTARCVHSASDLGLVFSCSLHNGLEMPNITSSAR